jgi:hypothetical protein
MTRPVTAEERARIEAALRKMEAAQSDLAATTRERDLAILDAYNRRAKVVELAEIAGLSRQAVHAIIKAEEQT